MNWNKHEMLVVSVVKGIKKSKKKKKQIAGEIHL